MDSQVRENRHQRRFLAAVTANKLPPWQHLCHLRNGDHQGDFSGTQKYGNYWGLNLVIMWMLQVFPVEGF